MVGLLDEPYCLTIEDVSNLTVRQVYFLYYRERDKEGRAKPLPYFFKDKEQDIKEKIAYFRLFGQQLGKSDEEIENLIEQAIKNGSI